MVSRARLSWGQRSRRPGCFASPYLIALGSPNKKVLFRQIPTASVATGLTICYKGVPTILSNWT
jgi:hypothetical protein